jgi:hypothetical protein
MRREKMNNEWSFKAGQKKVSRLLFGVSKVVSVQHPNPKGLMTLTYISISLVQSLINCSLKDCLKNFSTNENQGARMRYSLVFSSHQTPQIHYFIALI